MTISMNSQKLLTSEVFDLYFSRLLEDNPDLSLDEVDKLAQGYNTEVSLSFDSSGYEGKLVDPMPLAETVFRHGYCGMLVFLLCERYGGLPLIITDTESPYSVWQGHVVYQFMPSDERISYVDVNGVHSFEAIEAEFPRDRYSFKSGLPEDLFKLGVIDESLRDDPLSFFDDLEQVFTNIVVNEVYEQFVLTEYDKYNFNGL